jgi:DNA-binding beta-propeller fold protein YncE
MNAKWITLIVCSAVLIASAIPANAAEGETNTPFERGLLEEDANHQLEAAISNYQEALAYLVTNRQMLATAVFRLGECYRKQGKLNEARMQYRRILHDFPDQAELCRLSQQVVGNATNSPPAFVLSFGNTGPSPTNNLKFPGGVTVDASGNVYVSDTHNNRIQKFTARGVFLSQWGGSGTSAGRLAYPQCLATGGGYLYVADTHNNRIQKFTLDGSFVTQWGTLGKRSGQFSSPYGVAVDQTGNVYVADAHNHRIQKFTGDGAFLSEFGEIGAGPGQLDQPKSVALDRAGNLYVADTRNNRIVKFAADGTYLEEWGSYGKRPGQFDVAHDVAVDPWGNVYVADADGPSHNNRVQMFFNDGTLATLWGTAGSGPGEFNFASRVAVDPTGLLIYVCDASNHRVQLFAYGSQ